MSGHKTYSPETSGERVTLEVVRRKRGRPRNIPKEPPPDEPVKIRRKPGRPRKNTGTEAAAVEQDGASSFGISIPTPNDIQRLVADTLNVISAAQSHTASPSDSVSERDDGPEGLQRKPGRPKRQTAQPAFFNTGVSVSVRRGAKLVRVRGRRGSPNVIRNLSLVKLGPRGKRPPASCPGVQKRLKREGEKTTVKQKVCFPEQDRPEETGKVCSREADEEHIQQVTPTDPNESPPETIEYSRYGRKRVTPTDPNESPPETIEYSRYGRKKVTPTDPNKSPPETIEYSRYGRKRVTPTDPNKSHPQTLECSRHEREGSPEQHFKTFEPEQGDAIRNEQESEFQCKGCDLSFKFRSEYKIHVRRHIRGRRSQCLYAPNKRQVLYNGQEGRKKEEPVEKSITKEGEALVCRCGKTFSSRCSMDLHVKTHFPNRPYECHVCGICFSMPHALWFHEMTHWRENGYTCSHCKESFTVYRRAEKHVCASGTSQGLIPGRRALTFTCDLCSKTLLTPRGFYAHVKAHRDAEHQCVPCGNLFTFPSELRAHRYFCRKKGVRLPSGQGSKLVFAGPNSVTSPPASTSEGGHFSSRPLQSLQTRREEALVSCTPFKSSGSQEHQKPRNTGPNSVTSPPASTSEGGHFSSGPLQSLQTRREEALVSRAPSHSTLIPQHRSHFVSTFSSLDNRSDPRTYQCPHCGRLFRHMGRLRAHMLTHAQGQSYNCGICGKTVESWRKLYHHQRIHRHRRGRFSCPECGQGFRFAEPYRRHMAAHVGYQWVQRRSAKTPPLPYQCELCNASFETLDLLFSHQSCHFSSVRGVDRDPPLKWTLTLPENRCGPRGELSGRDADADNPSLPGATLQGTVPSSGPRQSFGSVLQPVSSFVSKAGYRTVKEGPVGTPSILKIQHFPQEAVGAGSPEDVRCAICGKCWPSISELYLHYLQHARGQL